jgi:hypothetical protein
MLASQQATCGPWQACFAADPCIQPPLCNGRRTLNGDAAPDPGSKDAQPGDVFEQLPTPVTAEFRDIRTWHRWAALAGGHLYADFRIVTERAPHRNLNDRERKRWPSCDGHREEELPT